MYLNIFIIHLHVQTSLPKKLHSHGNIIKRKATNNKIEKQKQKETLV